MQALPAIWGEAVTIFELLAWLYVIGVLVCSLVVALGCAWARYCSWRIERDRDLFWAELQRMFARRAARRNARHVKPQGPYR